MDYQTVPTQEKENIYHDDGKNVQSQAEKSMQEMKNLLTVEGHTENDKPDSQKDKDDPWAIETKEDIGPKWKELSTKRKILSVFLVILKLCGVLASLYLFICSLGFLGDAFKLVGGKAAGKTFRQSDLMSNPVAGLMIGVLATVLLQSSSTTTSIIITLAGEGIIELHSTIPMVMGANIGTSVTNTIVSLAQSINREEFRRAFGGAVLLDMFNWMTVLILLPVEVATSYLYYLTGAIVESMDLDDLQAENQEMLKAITKPFTKLILEIDKDVITGVATRRHGSHLEPILKRWCKNEDIFFNVSDSHSVVYYKDGNGTIAYLTNLTAQGISYVTAEVKWNTSVKYNDSHTIQDYIHVKRCKSLFAQTDLSDDAIGVLMLILSLILIISSLILIVKLLNSLLKGSLAQAIKRAINSEFPGKLAFLTGYVFILIGTGMTVIVQSSSVFTSMLTPLVGVGVVSLERMYPLTLGANVGTTITGILAAFSVSIESIPVALRVAMAHLFFNVTGILMFYPIPFTRKAPIKLAKILGNTTANYRWFAILYLMVMFFVFPAFIFGISLAGSEVLIGIGVPLLLLLAFVVIVNVMQRKCQHYLPRILKTWNFLPLFLHSLDPYDRVISKTIRFCHCCRKRSKV